MNIIQPNAVEKSTKKTKPKIDQWVPSSCALCYGSCSVLAHRVDDVIVKIEGNPNSVVGKGRLCGKGVSGIMSHYDPNRLTVPLRRTNPEKGIGVDPKWQEISWDEALDEIAEVLKKLRAEDPRKLVVQRTTTLTASRIPFTTFAAGFGTPNHSTAGGGLHCGNGAHLISGVMHASWGILPDFQYCNYAMFFGASKGHSAGHASTSNMVMAADARDRGMKLVVIDPMCNFASAKATEWVPLKVGTDGALALSMCNVLANELEALDVAYLKAKTNGPYLIGSDQQYARDPASSRSSGSTAPARCSTRANSTSRSCMVSSRRRPTPRATSCASTPRPARKSGNTSATPKPKPNRSRPTPRRTRLKGPTVCRS